MNQSFLVVLALAFTLSLNFTISGQTKIVKNTYLFGAKDAKVDGKILVKFDDLDLRAQSDIMRKMKKTYDATNFSEVFFAGYDDENEMRQTALSKGYKHIFHFREENSRLVNVSNTEGIEKQRKQLFYVPSLDNRVSRSKSSGVSSSLVAMVEFSLSLYDASTNFEEPRFILTSKWDVGNHISPEVAKRAAGKDNRSVLSERCIKRILNGLETMIKKYS